MLGKCLSKMTLVFRGEEGSLSDMTWVIGSAVVVVLVIGVFMTLAPDTARTIWNSFVDYAEDAFGI